MFDIWIGNRGISHHIRGFHGFLKMFQNPMNEHNETITQRVFFWIAPHGQPNSPPARHGLESCPHPGRQFHVSDLGGRNCYAKFANNSGNPKWNSKNKKSNNMVNICQHGIYCKFWVAPSFCVWFLQTQNRFQYSKVSSTSGSEGVRQWCHKVTLLDFHVYDIIIKGLHPHVINILAEMSCVSSHISY